MVGAGLLGILALLAFLGCLVCFVMVLIKQFQTAGPVHGIIGIVTCSLWTLIWGWMNATNLNIKKLMMIWTALIVVYIVLYIAGAGMMFSQMGQMPTTTTP
jgi:hypothetical protein